MSTRIDPYKNFKFRIIIDGVTSGAFKNVEGLDSETEVVEFRSGVPKSQTAIGVYDYAALNRASHLGRPGALLLKGFIPLSPLKRLLQNRQAHTHKRSVAIQQKASSGKVVAQWEFTNAWPSKWKGPATKSGTLPSPDKILLTFQKVQLSSSDRSSKGSRFKGEVISIEPKF